MGRGGVPSYNRLYADARLKEVPFVDLRYIKAGAQAGFFKGGGGITLCQTLSSWCFRHGIL